MGTVEQLKTEAPTEQTAQRDAIGALADRILADVDGEIAKVQQGLDDLRTAAIQNTADVKARLAGLVAAVVSLKKEMKHLEVIVQDTRAELARPIGDRSGAT